MLTAAEARAIIQSREGLTEDPRTGCWLIAPELRAASGMGPYLAFYEAVAGAPPDGFDVVHRCPGALLGCVRPSHLDVEPRGARVTFPPDPGITWELRDAFPARIRDERDARRMNRPEFARTLKVSPHTIKAWEEGRRVPASDTYRQIAAALGWDGRPRKWAVVFVHEEVVTATTSGEAMRTVWEALEREGKPRKTAVFSVRPATK
jgi:transcriptional regulator with XRE-family HTH domain